MGSSWERAQGEASPRSLGVCTVWGHPSGVRAWGPRAEAALRESQEIPCWGLCAPACDSGRPQPHCHSAVAAPTPQPPPRPRGCTLPTEGTEGGP